MDSLMKIIEADIRNWKAYVTYVVNPESVGEYGTIRTWDRTHFDISLGVRYANSHQVLPSSKGDT